MRCGFISLSQFLRGLDMLGISGLQRLYLSDKEIENVCKMYADAGDPKRVNWKSFETDIEEGMRV